MVHRTYKKCHDQVERHRPEVACRHPTIKPGSDDRQEGCVLVKQFRRHFSGAVPGKGLLQKKRRRPRMSHQPFQVIFDGVLHALLGGRIRCEDRAGAALIFVEHAVVKRRDQLIFRAEVVVEGSNAH